MDTQAVKIISLHILGGVIGGISGWMIAHIILENAIEKDIPFDDYGKAYRNLPDYVEDYTEPTNVVPDGEDIVLVKPTSEDTLIKNMRKRKKSKTVDYTTFSKTNQEKPPIEELAARYESQEEPQIPSDIHVIPMEEYLFPGGRYAKHRLTYYEDDDVLCDEAEIIVQDVGQTVTDDALLRFGEMSEDPDTVYVRNTKAMTDYEITRMHSSYSEMVVGGQVIERKKKRRTKKVKEFDDENETN